MGCYTDIMHALHSATPPPIFHVLASQPVVAEGAFNLPLLLVLLLLLLGAAVAMFVSNRPGMDGFHSHCACGGDITKDDDPLLR